MKIINLSLYTLIFCGAIILLLPKATFAAGCCEQKNIPDNGQVLYTSAETEDECKRNISATKGAKFYAGYTVAPDARSCIPPPPPTTPEKQPEFKEVVPPSLSVIIPGFTKFSEVRCMSQDDPCEVPWIGEYIKSVFNFSVTAIGILAAIVIMIGGVIWLTAGGNQGRISEGRNFIRGGIFGVLLIICSYLVLYLVNPDLTIFPAIKIGYIAREDLEVIDTYSDQVDAPTDNLKYPDTKVYDPKKEKPSNVKGCDDCVVTSLTTKNNKNINKDLNAALLKVRSSVPWRITEAFPPTSKHQSKCHYNGHCVDIGKNPPSNTSCGDVEEMIRAFKAAGLVVLNEYTSCNGKQTKYGTAGHLHVRLP